MNDDDNDRSIRKMADTLRKGATMLDLACPICNNPIFKLKNGRMACVVCEREVILDRGEQQETIAPVLDSIRKDDDPGDINLPCDIEISGREPEKSPLILVLPDIYFKIQEICKKIKDSTYPDEISKWIVVLQGLLNCLEKIQALS